MLFVLLLTSNNLTIQAETNSYLELPVFFSSNMVLQCDVPLKFWGWANPQDTVIVEFYRQDEKHQTSVGVDPDGKWTAYLEAQPVTVEACELRFSVKGFPSTLKILNNVLVGDVWFAAGQSNMEKKVSHLLEADQYITEANQYPMIRSFKTSYNATVEPQEKVNKTSLPWFVCDSQMVGNNVSAVAYVFARYVQEDIQIPIGIIQSYRGGTEIETWISPWKFAEEQYCKLAGRKDFLEELNRLNSHSVNFNGQINPLKGYPIKGFIWYQGESNTKRAKEYRYMMKMLIEDWRSLWNQGDLPFYYVQMYNYGTPAIYDEYNWVDIREQQEFLLYDKTVSNVGMSVIIDTNEEATNPDVNIRAHPRNKKPVGERLARIALNKTYGKHILSEGPIVNRYKIKNDSVFLYFRNCGNGLKIKTNETSLNGFILSGTDKNFKTAEAKIINDSTVVVTSKLVAKPVAVRYAWARNPICNLYSSIDLPAMPFRSDMWDSKVTYSQFETSCSILNDDASLVSIRLNGVPVKGFVSTQFNYDFTTNPDNEFPDVLAIPNSPWAKVSVEKNPELRKIIITVTAENGKKQAYKIKLNADSSISSTTDNHGFTFFRQNSTLVIQNNDIEKVDVMIFNLYGQCIFDEEIKQNEQKLFKATSGVYLLTAPLWKYNRKVLLL